MACISRSTYLPRYLNIYLFILAQNYFNFHEFCPNYAMSKVAKPPTKERELTKHFNHWWEFHLHPIFNYCSCKMNFILLFWLGE